jgi:glycosyltransferase involved in cell wall biosynthesis
MRTLPVSAVVPTCNRRQAIQATLESLLQQQCRPAELIVVDASDGSGTRQYLDSITSRVRGHCTVRWLPAVVRGAAAQRNQGVEAAGHETIWFFDDDIIFEPACVERLWLALRTDASLGGVSATIRNQRYIAPGLASRMLFTLLDGHRRSTFAGRVIGPAVNLLPEDRDDLSEVVTVEWLNAGCTMYRRQALPSPPFDPVFTGYSLMEDLTLSLRVGRTWRLANARTARIFHDSQPTSFKADAAAVAAMESFNRHYVMTKILGRTGVADYLRLFAWDIFQLASCLAQGKTRSSAPGMIRGKSSAYARVWRLRGRTARIGENGRAP